MTAPQQKPPTKTESKELVGVKRLKSLLSDEAIKKQFNEVLGKRAPQFISSIVTAVNQNKQLQDCDPMTVIGSAAIAAAMDLPINPGLGQAHIVPYKGVATFQIGWKGLVQLAMRSGQYLTMNLTPVLEGQLVRRNTFTGEMEFHEEATSDKIVGYLLYFKLLNGYEKYFYMTKEECLAHGKQFSQSFKKNFGPWVDNFDAMALKTVCKMGLSKYGILSIEMQKAVISDESTETDGITVYPDGMSTEGMRDVSPDAPPKKSRLESVVEAQISATPEAAASPESSNAGESPSPKNPTPEEAAAREVDKMMEKS